MAHLNDGILLKPKGLQKEEKEDINSTDVSAEKTRKCPYWYSQAQKQTSGLRDGLGATFLYSREVITSR